MRWAALGVDYEMAGKDLIDLVKLSSQICRVLGGEPPEGFNYELFLDEQGQKISKSKGNGLSMEEWLRYAAPESLALLHVPVAEGRRSGSIFDVAPKATDEYLQQLESFNRGKAEGTNAPAIDNPVGTSTPPRRRSTARRSPSPCS